MRVQLGVIAAVVVAGVLAGCGGSDCNQTPPLNRAPTSCTLQASAPVTVNVRWCSCGASTVCDVTYNADAGVFQLEPKVSSCDASCPANPTSCSVDSVPCTFTTPPSSGASYSLYIIDGLNPSVTVPLNLGGSATTCG